MASGTYKPYYKGEDSSLPPLKGAHKDSDYNYEDKANRLYDYEYKQKKALKTDRPWNGKQSDNIKDDESRAKEAKASTAAGASIGLKLDPRKAPPKTTAKKNRKTSSKS
jgi:hypothetical protein